MATATSSGEERWGDPDVPVARVTTVREGRTSSSHRDACLLGQRYHAVAVPSTTSRLMKYPPSGSVQVAASQSPSRLLKMEVTWSNLGPKSRDAGA